MKGDYIRRLSIVLPLTREWIEMLFLQHDNEIQGVLPLTREWIEISASPFCSGQLDSSPSYEGVDRNLVPVVRTVGNSRSPSYEGVD